MGASRGQEGHRGGQKGAREGNKGAREGKKGAAPFYFGLAGTLEITATPDQDHTDFTKGLTLLVDAIRQKKVL